MAGLVEVLRKVHVWGLACKQAAGITGVLTGWEYLAHAP